MAFVGTSIQPEIRRANFVIVLEWLKGLSDRDDVPLQETCILTLCRLAKYVYVIIISYWFRNSSICLYRVSDDEEMNIILLRLLEYLGHANPYVCALAYNEVRVSD